MAMPRFTRQIGVQAAPANPAAGAEGNELHQELERFSSQRAAELANQAEEASYIQGQEAGATGGAADANTFTARGRAYNRGALIAHQAAIQTDIRDSVGKFAAENPRDPDAFSARVDGLSLGLLKEADPRLHPFIRQRVADYAGAAKLNIIETQQQELRKASIGDLQRGAEGMFADATTAAFEGNVPMIEARRQELTNLLKEGVHSQFLTDGEAKGLHKKFEHEVTQQELVGNFDRLIRTKGIDAGNPAIDRWQATKPSNVGLSVEEHEQVTRQMVGMLNREQAQLADSAAKRNATVAAEHVQRKGRVDDAIKVLREGFSPDKDQARAVSEDLRWLQSSGDPADQARGRELAHDYDAANAIQGQVHQFRRMNETQRAAALTKLESHLRQGGASADQVQLLTSLRTTSAAVDREMQTDPRGYVNREGLIEDTPLDFSNSQNLASSIQAREANTEIGRQLAGKPLPRFTAAEADQIAQAYTGTADEPTPIEEKLGILGVITQGAGDDALATLGQLDKKGNKRMALLGGMVMHGQGTTARDVMRGEQVLAGAPAVKPEQSDYQPAVDSAWRGALGDWPEQRGVYMDAAVAKYAELKARAGDLSDTYNARFMKEALNAVLPTAEYNDRRVAVPPGVTNGAFEDWTNSWTPDMFQGVAGATGEELLRLVKNRGRLMEVGHGQYGIILNSAASGRDKVLVDGNGKPFRLQYPLGEQK